MASICVDISPAAHGKAGLGRYAGELAEAAHRTDRENTYRLFTYDPVSASIPSSLAGLPLLTVGLSSKPWRMRVLLGHWARRPMDRLFPNVDLFHSTDHLLPNFRRIRSVFTLHDLTPQLFPQLHLPMNRWYLSLMLPRFMRQADAVITVSECTKRDALRLYPMAEEKVRVIYEGVDAKFRPVRDPSAIARAREKYKLPERYILNVGTIEPRKNLTRLLDAYDALRKDGFQHGLVLAGARGWLCRAVFERIAELGLAEQVVLPGYIADEDLPTVYAGAALFAFPSLYEGFGLPALEALASGVPTVVSNASSLPEIVGDAALQVPPTDAAALKGAMARVLSDPELAAQLAAAGPKRASRFTWEKAAQDTVAVYRQVLG